ncbi:MAG: hypothetical protein ACRBCI_00575 [Cellvibrionaceae bacterium]
MAIADISGTSCAFIPVYCYYDRDNGGEVKTPILMMDQDTFLLKAIILDIDPSIFNPDELKDQFIEAYYQLSSINPTDDKSLDPYDIYPQLVSVLHTDSEEISIYVCELFENSEPYFKKQNRSKITEPVTYKEGIDNLIQGGALDSLTEKILVALSEEDYITGKDDKGTNSIELF